MSRVLLGLLVLLSACALPQPTPDAEDAGDAGVDPCRTFVVSPAFTAEEREALQRAVARWNEISIEPFCLHVDAAADNEATTHAVYRIAYRSPYWYSVSESFGGADFYGVHFGGTDRIGIVDVLGVDLFELVALHEFGHAHGLGHTEAPAIMAPAADSSKDFTPIDMAECRRVGACL